MPSAKITKEDTFSIVSDYIGKPIAAYNGVGNLVWDVEYDIFGNIRSQSKGDKDFIPFRNQGQYEDSELNGLMYNRFRYYDGNSGTYISQDPIRLHGSNPNLYGYTFDSNNEVDVFGLSPYSNWTPTSPMFPSTNQSHELLPDYGGGKTYGVLEIGNETHYLQSGQKGPGELPGVPTGTGSGRNGNIKTHVEAHATAIMHLEGSQKATLYINQLPCPGPGGCDNNLKFMLPEGAELTVKGPNGFEKTYVGCKR